MLNWCSTLLMAAAVAALAVGYDIAISEYSDSVSDPVVLPPVRLLPYIGLLVAGVVCGSYARNVAIAIAGSVDIALSLALLGTGFFHADEAAFGTLAFGVGAAGIVVAALLRIRRWGRFVAVFSAEVLDAIIFFVVVMLGILAVRRSSGAWLAVIASIPILLPVALRTESFGYLIAGLRMVSESFSKPGRSRLFTRALLKVFLYLLITIAGIWGGITIRENIFSPTVGVCSVAILVCLLDAFAGSGTNGGMVDRALKFRYTSSGVPVPMNNPETSK
jgi:hypothetical protein